MFLRNSMLPGVSCQQLLSDVAVGLYQTLAEVYRAAKAVNAVPMTGMSTRLYRGYGRSGGRATPARGRGGWMAARGEPATRQTGGRMATAVDLSNVVCWHCGQWGHRRQECPELRGVQAHTEETGDAAQEPQEIELQEMSALRLTQGSPESF